MRLRSVFALFGVAAGLAWLARDVPLAFGARPPARPSPRTARRLPGALDRADRIAKSGRFRDGAFRNVDPPHPMRPGTTREAMLGMIFSARKRRPSRPVPLVRPDFTARDGLHVTWLGHSTSVVEIDGARVLLDPVWSDRCSPSGLAGPHRLHPMPLPIENLPRLDAIVISHDHYDHLDLSTVRALTARQDAPFLVPLGVGAHLERWGVPVRRIVELDWDEHAEAGGVRFTATAARHFSGRFLARDATLWSSWVLTGPEHRLFYSGDTGYFPGYAAIGEAYGPFDATIVQAGAYADPWPDIHMEPEDAVTAHREAGGGLLIPVHWGTFALAVHGWSEPPDRVWAEARARGVALAVPRPGERVDVADPPPVDGWWQAVV
ncbi:L-ascorbate metabolism protein UlaG (beta-lactamase superfamily) [Catenuloplanes nepalensis]|uniref:L-ascorbate metabolism protein UlaG (Beta-lactamase superfamily) n=1 Tax=Catenuloplanes nepalensis TaxID=587533 RepID=A0ABT9N2F5_9ACTN|nr:MBL fold metallo-hydrolase [Catenuloplanes nepalensis]MDP9797688.1 L-ascorbate metabolism protein UlaG (beta-lactamase superfamily) [Catenuloplanes nepalensis]